MTTRQSEERGSVSLLVVIMVPALLIAAGLVLDGGRQLEARRQAGAAAAAAARAGAQMTEQEAYAAALDVGLAGERAHARLRALGSTGVVTVEPAGVTVTVTATVDHLILPGSRDVSSSASAAPRPGVTGEGQP